MPRYILDITRILSRVGHGQVTGIDRVERHYFDYVLKNNSNCLFLARMGSEIFLLDASTGHKMRSNLDNSEGWGTAGLKDGLRLKLPKSQRAARSFLRRNATHSARAESIESLFSQTSLEGYTYLNIGHSNLNEKVFLTLKKAGISETWVFVHDLIPLDHPEFTKVGIPENFETKMRSAARHATRIITNSEVTAGTIRTRFGQWGAVPHITVAHLGTERLNASTDSRPQKPYFLILGTIEPRKNHLTVFHAWERLSELIPSDQMPNLIVVGQRGWNNEDVFQFLDTSPLIGKHIFERDDVTDDELAALLTSSTALLFPSHVEGYGMPALEAASLGVPVVCSNIQIFIELLGSYGVYLKPDKADEWVGEIQRRLKNPELRQDGNRNASKMPRIPTWESHFRHVFARP